MVLAATYQAVPCVSFKSTSFPLNTLHIESLLLSLSKLELPSSLQSFKCALKKSTLKKTKWSDRHAKTALQKATVGESFNHILLKWATWGETIWGDVSCLLLHYFHSRAVQIPNSFIRMIWHNHDIMTKCIKAFSRYQARTLSAGCMKSSICPASGDQAQCFLDAQCKLFSPPFCSW